MPDYYDTVYRQVIRQLQDKSTRPPNQEDKKLQQFSWAILVIEDSLKSVTYDVVEKGSLLCMTNRIKQWTGLISIEVDTHKLSNSYYLLQVADRLTYQLCNASLLEFGK